jgi:hypothetical protein
VSAERIAGRSPARPAEVPRPRRSGRARAQMDGPPRPVRRREGLSPEARPAPSARADRGRAGKAARDGVLDRLEDGFSRARCRTTWLRRVTAGRSARVRWSGTQTSAEAAGVEPRQHGRVDHVGLDPRLGDS